MPMTNNPEHRYRCQHCLHRHFWTPNKTFTLKDQKRVVAAETNFGSWGQCEDPDCSCISLYRLTQNQLEILLNKAEELLGRPIGHRPPGVVIPDVPQRQGPAEAPGGDGSPAADLPLAPATI